MRLLSFLRGARAERSAARWLSSQGFEILLRNLRVGRDELDLIARDGEVLVIVEVRQRRAGTLAADQSIDRAKEERLLRAASEVRRRFRLSASLPTRFDLVLLSDDTRAPVHLRGVLGRSKL